MPKSKLPVEQKDVNIAMASPNLPRSKEDEKSEQAEKRRYMAEDALRDLERAKKHESNKELMRDVKKLAKEKIKDLGKVCK